MKRNFDVNVVDYDGRPHVRQVMKFDPKTGMPVMKEGVHQFSHFEPMTLRLYALDALGGRWPGEERIDGGARMVLYHKICMSNGTVYLNTEDGPAIIAALTNQNRAFVVIDAMQKLLSTDPEPPA